MNVTANGTTRLLQWVVGILASLAVAALLAFLSWVGASVSDMNTRLTRLDATIAEGRAERQEQVADLRARMSRVEQEVFRSIRERPALD